MNIFVITVSGNNLVGLSGLEPPTSRLSGARSNQLSYKPMIMRCFSFILFPFVTVVTGGDDGIRTHDPLLAGQVLSQLSYTPIMRFPLAGCWHRPIFPSRFQLSIFGTAQLNFCVRNGNRWTLCVSGTNYYFHSVTEN